MEQFVYITDVFCPWCFGFSPVLHEILNKYPYPIQVLCGNLVDEPTMTNRWDSPNIRDFFARLSKTTGRKVGENFRNLLMKEHAVLMDSSKSALLMKALSFCSPGNELEQMDLFQKMFYIDGADVLSLEVQKEKAAQWNISPKELELALNDEKIIEAANRELDVAEEILGDFVVYPSLFLHMDNEYFPLARGYAPFTDVETKLKNCLQGKQQSNIAKPSLMACGLDGKCFEGK